MSNTMTRSFLPVGQGAFYRETFNIQNEDGYNNTVNVVYDCGTSTKGTDIRTIIENEFLRGETIDALFISHFDDDHINGIQHLAQYCRIKNIFMPLLTTKEVIYSQLYSLSKYNTTSIAYQLYVHNGPFINIIKGKETQTHFIRPANDDDNNDKNSREYYDIRERNIINSGTNIASYISVLYATNWEYIPYNYRRKDRVTKFEKALSEVFDNAIPDVAELINNFSQYIDNIKEAFKKVPGDFNTNSMTLFSGIRNSKKIQYDNSYSLLSPCRAYPIGCLYTGDYDANGSDKWEQLYKAYQPYWDYIGCIQVPHHGSRYNYNVNIGNTDAIFIISAGSINQFKHPHTLVMEDLLLHKRNIHLVTENKSTQTTMICAF